MSEVNIETKTIRACYAYGRITIKFMEKAGLFEKEWALTAIKKELDENKHLEVKTEKPKEEMDRYGTIFRIKNVEEETEIFIDQIGEFGVNEAREMWDALVEWGFKPTQQTDKIIKKKVVEKQYREAAMNRYVTTTIYWSLKNVF